MIRRLSALLLVLACVFAPALRVYRFAAAEKPTCCCQQSCACNPTECPAPASTPVVASPVTLAAVEQPATAAKPARSVARSLFLSFLLRPETAPVRRSLELERSAPAASVALFRVHCSLLI